MSESNKATIQEFYGTFQAARTDLSSRVENLKAQPSVSPDTLNEFALDVAKLRKDLVDATNYLPSYDQRQYESFLKELEQSLEQLRLTTVQKPKFSFKRKSATTRPPGASTEKPNVVAVPSSKSKTHVNSSGNRIVSNRRKQYIDWSSITSSGSSASDLTISDLDHCIVNFATSNEVPSNTHDAPKQHLITALHVRNVTDSVLLFPPIEGSALLHDLNRCTIVLGCHQFRMHSSSHMSVYLYISSNPIIEHCTDIAFAAYPGRLSHTLPILSDASKHLSVQDFSHIRATPSPNWHALDSSEAIAEDEWLFSSVMEDGTLDDILRRLLPST